MTEEFSELNYQDFVLARKLHRQQETKSAARDASAPESAKEPLLEEDSKFILYSDGPDGIFAVFEDTDQTGWFYLYDANQRKILQSAHIYNHAEVIVEEDIVDIGWAADDSACGLALWGEFRAFFGLSNDFTLLKPLTDPEERGIPPAEWPAGFGHYIEKKFD
jgi:Uncharacterized protein conserved in bacteria (DUF2251)